MEIKPVIFHCQQCQQPGPAVDLDHIYICARHRVTIFVDGELKHQYIPSEGIEKELQNMGAVDMLKRVNEIESRKKQEAYEDSPRPFGFDRPLTFVLEKTEMADEVGEGEELFL